MTLLVDIVGDNIRKHRETMGLTKQGLAKKLNLTSCGSTVSFWERGLRMPDAQNLCLLADVFGCSVDELLGRTVKTDGNV